MKLFLTCLAVITAAAGCRGESTGSKSDVKLPDYVPTCSLSKGDVNACMKQIFQDFVPKLKDGNKDLNIPPIDPYRLQKSTYQYSNGGIKGQISIKDTKITGLSKTIIEDIDLKIYENGTHTELFTRVPNIFVEGAYKAEININDIKLKPRGLFNITITDMKIKNKVDGEFYEKDGLRFLRVTSFEAFPEIGDMKFLATGIFPDPTLNAIVLDYINQSWRQFYKTILPETRMYYEPIYLALINNVVQNYPFHSFLTKD